MATALEFYKANTVTPANFTGAYVTYLTCTVDRSAKADTKNFFVIAHVSTTVSNIDTTGKIRLQQDGSTDLGEVADGLEYYYTSPCGYTYNFVKRVSLDNTSHSFTLDLGRVAGSKNFQGQNASIIVLEESVNAEYADSTATTGTGDDTGWVDYLNLQFSPASTQNYLLIFSCETKSEDESDSGAKGIQLIETDIGPTIYLTENDTGLAGSVNDNRYRTVGGACFANLNSAYTYNFKIQMQGDGVDDEIYCRKGAIIAIPFGDFENVYTDSQSAKTFHQGTDFSDTDVVMAAQACNAADHLIIAGFEFSNEFVFGAGYWRLCSDGVDFVVCQLPYRDEDSNQYYLGFAVHGKTLTSGDKNFEVEGNSTSSDIDYEGCGRNGYLVVAEIPTEAPPPTYIPKVIMITGILGMIALKIVSYLKIMLGGVICQP